MTDIDAIIPFGKHKGKTYAYVWETAPQYIRWLARESFLDDVREIADGFVHPTDTPARAKDVAGVDISAIDTSRLYPHQISGVKFVEDVGGRCIIADEMGLGKTIEAIMCLNLHPDEKTLIICPATLKINWERELALWLDKERLIQVISGRKNEAIVGDIIIINYDILSAHKTALVASGVRLVIADESHYAKNQKSKRTKAMMEICKKVPHVILLSGTPIKSRPAELWAQLNCIDSKKYNSFYKFAHKYCDAHKVKMGNKEFWDFGGASNLAQLNDELGSIMLRRTKDEVLDLPEKMSQIVPVSCTIKEYRRIENDSTTENPLARNTELIMESMRTKIAPTTDFIGNMLDQGHKVVVFCTHNEMLDSIAGKFDDVCVCVRGGMAAEAKDEAVTMFQTSYKCRLFVGNVQAAGVGITLTAASHVVFAETPWTPTDVDQASDRCHRIGQKNVVNVYHLCAAGTIDEHVIDTVASKRKVFDATMGHDHNL